MTLSLLKADASISEVNKLCKEAREFKLGGVCVNPVHVERCVQFAGDEMPVSAVVGYPLGANHPETKIFEADLAVQQGASAVELVLNTGLLKTSNFQEVFEELRAVRYACPESDLTIILETALMDPLQIIIGCMLCREAGADDVKTSTQNRGIEKSAETVSLMRFVLGDDLGVIAAGDISTVELAQNHLHAGASRLSVEFIQAGTPLSAIFTNSEQAVD